MFNCNKRISQLKVDTERYLQKVLDLSDQCLKTVRSIIKRRKEKHLVDVQMYEERYKTKFNRPVQFLRFIKQRRCPQRESLPKVTQPCKYIINCLFANQDEVKHKRQARNEHLLQRTDAQIYPYIFMRVNDIDRCCHVSCLAQDFVWVSDEQNLILTNDCGVCIDRIPNAVGFYGGIHTINRKLELIYISSDFTINKRALDRTSNTFIKRKNQILEPRCIYCSKSTGEVFVVFKRNDSNVCKVSIYNETGACIIQHTNTNYRNPIFITENTNTDVVVTDEEHQAVMVSTRRGKHRFSYKGPPGSIFEPRGICTDPLSHILVCNLCGSSVQMIDKDGQFLLFLLVPHDISFQPFSICYDSERHIVVVGSKDFQRTISAYRYIDRNLGEIGNFFNCSK